jgi:metal-responsive CopG/Arc/MetJ family transcriptional regulator
MAEQAPMARMQVLLPQDLKAEIELFAKEQGVSANEAIRVLSRRGLTASGKVAPVSFLVEELGYRVRDLEQRLAKCEASGA